MMGRRDRYKGPGEHPVTCRVCRRMAGKKFRTRKAKQRLNRRLRRNQAMLLLRQLQEAL